jgi:hypoxia up-regulated 1
MILSNSKSVASEYAEIPLKDAVLTVPPFFNQAQRKAVLL